jgi:hypothetical protein
MQWTIAFALLSHSKGPDPPVHRILRLLVEARPAWMLSCGRWRSRFWGTAASPENRQSGCGSDQFCRARREELALRCPGHEGGLPAYLRQSAAVEVWYSPTGCSDFGWSGGTGRRARLKILWSTRPWGFKSLLQHQHSESADACFVPPDSQEIAFRPASPPLKLFRSSFAPGAILSAQQRAFPAPGGSSSGFSGRSARASAPERMPPATLYDLVGSVKRHLEFVSRGGSSFFFLLYLSRNPFPLRPRLAL